MIYVSAFFFALGGFLNACMDRSRDGYHEGSWLFEARWVQELAPQAEQFILGIVPKDFWHLAKWFMWLAFGFAHATWRIAEVDVWGHVYMMFAQGASFLFWYHAGLYRNPVHRLLGYFKKVLHRISRGVNDDSNG